MRELDLPVRGVFDSAFLRRWPRQQAPGGGCEMNTVVGYKPRKTQGTGAGGVDELQRKP